MKTNYYDGTKLLSMKDSNGETPEIFICTSNRSAGKTTYFNRYVVNRFRKYGEKFALLYRYTYELDECADKFFKDIRGLFFQDCEMTSESRAKGAFHELFLNGISCGYAIALNGADNVKKYSHFFSDVARIIFDEFQSETNKYCANEINKFISVHMSISRGNHKQVRYVPVYMISNPVTILNPYYVNMGITNRLREDTKFLKGDGYVLEQGFNKDASDAQKQSGFNRAFKTSDYVGYASEAIYLNDNKAFIDKPVGKNYYLATLKFNNREYGVREYPERGIVFCDDRADASYPVKITVTTADHDVNYVMLKKNSNYINTMRFYFEHGCFRFKDLRCKEAILNALSYK